MSKRAAMRRAAKARRAQDVREAAILQSWADIGMTDFRLVHTKELAEEDAAYGLLQEALAVFPEMRPLYEQMTDPTIDVDLLTGRLSVHEWEPSDGDTSYVEGVR